MTLPLLVDAAEVSQKLIRRLVKKKYTSWAIAGGHELVYKLYKNIRSFLMPGLRLI
jgi:hypothetical protein